MPVILPLSSRAYYHSDCRRYRRCYYHACHRCFQYESYDCCCYDFSWLLIWRETRWGKRMHDVYETFVEDEKWIFDVDGYDDDEDDDSVDCHWHLSWVR